MRTCGALNVESSQGLPIDKYYDFLSITIRFWELVQGIVKIMLGEKVTLLPLKISLIGD
jgi:hypothetical protein